LGGDVARLRNMATTTYMSSVDDARRGLVRYPPDFEHQYRSAGFWTRRSLPAELMFAASAHASEQALVTAEGTWSYQELFVAAQKFAGGLLTSTRLRPGDAVMFQMGNVAETVVSYLGCLLAGIRPVCTLPQHGVREISVLAKHIGARGLIIQADFGRGQLPTNARALVNSGIIQDVVVARGFAEGFGVSYQQLLASSGPALATALPYHHCDPRQIAVFQLSGEPPACRRSRLACMRSTPTTPAPGRTLWAGAQAAESCTHCRSCTMLAFRWLSNRRCSAARHSCYPTPLTSTPCSA